MPTLQMPIDIETNGDVVFLQKQLSIVSPLFLQQFRVMQLANFFFFLSNNYRLIIFFLNQLYPALL